MKWVGVQGDLCRWNSSALSGHDRTSHRGGDRDSHDASRDLPVTCKCPAINPEDCMRTALKLGPRSPCILAFFTCSYVHSRTLSAYTGHSHCHTIPASTVCSTVCIPHPSVIVSQCIPFFSHLSESHRAGIWDRVSHGLAWPRLALLVNKLVVSMWLLNNLIRRARKRVAHARRFVSIKGLISKTSANRRKMSNAREGYKTITGRTYASKCMCEDVSNREWYCTIDGGEKGGDEERLRRNEVVSKS
jgi:hypothetical protein